MASAQHLSQHLPQAGCWFWAPGGQVYSVEPRLLATHRYPFEKDFVVADPPLAQSLPEALDSPAVKKVVFFLALHGGDGENGVVQRLFESRHLAFTGSDSAASAIGFDKLKTRQVATAASARMADAANFEPLNVSQAQQALKQLLSRHPRWVLKPRADGSSHGLIHLRDPADVGAAAETMATLGVPYLAEVFVDGRELTVGVVDLTSGPAALEVSEVRLIPGGSFDYAGKYLGRGTQEITPAALTPEERLKAQALAILTHRAVGCYGYSRTDMILTQQDVCLLEINTLPGLTQASFIPQQLAASNMSMKEFVARQIQLAQERRDRVTTHGPA